MKYTLDIESYMINKGKSIVEDTLNKIFKVEGEYKIIHLYVLEDKIKMLRLPFIQCVYSKNDDESYILYFDMINRYLVTTDFITYYEGNSKILNYKRLKFIDFEGDNFHIRDEENAIERYFLENKWINVFNRSSNDPCRVWILDNDQLLFELKSSVGRLFLVK